MKFNVSMRRSALSLFVVGAWFTQACGGPVTSSGGGASDVGGSGGSAGSSVTGSAGGGGTFANICPGVTPWPASRVTCRTSTECENGYACVDTPFTGCGMCMMPAHECVSDADCGGGLCEEYEQTGLCACGGLGTKCIPHCLDVACAAGFTCDPAGRCQPLSCAEGFACASDMVCGPAGAGADIHDCRPRPCDAGFTCGEGTTCAMGSAGADEHGCAPIHCMDGFTCPVNTTCTTDPDGHGCQRLSCEVDTDCDCGACVGGVCESQIRICDRIPV